MNRSRHESWVLPLVLAALVLRALIPVGFMAGAPGTSLAVSMCLPSTGTQTIEIPGVAMESHCDFCFAAMLGSAPAFAASPPERIVTVFTAATLPSPEARFTLERAQSPRGPPAA